MNKDKIPFNKWEKYYNGDDYVFTIIHENNLWFGATKFLKRVGYKPKSLTGHWEKLLPSMRVLPDEVFPTNLQPTTKVINLDDVISMYKRMRNPIGKQELYDLLAEIKETIYSKYYYQFDLYSKEVIEARFEMHKKIKKFVKENKKDNKWK